MQIDRATTGLKKSLPMANRELRQRAHFSQLSSATVQIVKQDTAQHAKILACSNQIPHAETHNVEKATTEFTAVYVTKGKLTLSALGTPSLDQNLTCDTALEHL